jgi:hypothetical protein
LHEYTEIKKRHIRHPYCICKDIMSLAKAYFTPTNEILANNVFVMKPDILNQLSYKIIQIVRLVRILKLSETYE